MKKLKSFIFVALMVCFSSVIFSACGKKEDPAPPPPASFTITYQTCGGTFALQDMLDSNGIPVIIPKTEELGGGVAYFSTIKNGDYLTEVLPTRDGYIFTGWYEDSGYTIKFDFDTKIVKDYTLYAKWSNDLSEIYTFELSGGAEPYYTITAFNGKAKELVLPEEYLGVRVAAIGANAFKNSKFLEEITFSSSIKSIAADSFASCENLKEVNFNGTAEAWLEIDFASISSNPVWYAHSLTIDGEPVIDINVDTELVKSYSLAGLRSLNSITLTKNVKQIAADAFADCINCAAVKYEGDLQDWLKIDFASYYSNPVTSSGDLYFNNENTALETLDLSETSIPKYAFAGLGSLKTLNLQSGVTTIKEGAFQGSGIESLTLPKTIASVEASAFRDCKWLTSLNLSSVTRLGKYAFADCEKLTSIYIDTPTDVQAQAEPYEADNYIFSNAGSGANGIALKLSATALLCNNIFVPHGDQNLPKITSLEFESGRLGIANCKEFNTMANLATIKVPESVQNIEFGIFNNTPWFKNQKDGCVVINNKAYGYKGDTTNIVIPAIVLGYYNEFYDYIKNMQTLELSYVGKSREASGKDALFGAIFSQNSEGKVEITQTYGAGEKVNFYIPSTLRQIKMTGLNYIPRGAFSGLTCIEKLDFSACSALTSIGEYAFYDFPNIENIVLPNREIRVDNNLYQNMPTNFIQIHYYDSTPHGTVTNSYQNKVGLVSLTAIPNSNYVAVWCNENGEYLNDISNISNTKDIAVKLSYNVLDVYVKFVWESYTITLNYDCQYVASGTISLPVKFGKEIVYPTDKERGGYDLAGWYLDDGKPFTDTVYLLDYNITLTAHWSEPIFTTSSETNGLMITGFTAYGQTKTELIIPSSIDGTPVKSIMLRAFSENQNISSVTIRDGIETINNGAFYRCPNLVSVVIESGVKILDFVFRECTNLTDVTFGSGATTLGSSVFYGCTNLKNIENMSSVESIDAYAFGNCKNLQTAIFGDNLKSLGDHAFDNCENLQTVVLGNNLNSISAAAFYNCKSLTSITLGSNLTKIEKVAFLNCTSLSEVIYLGNVEQWSKIDFSDQSGAGEYLYGDTATSNPLYYAKHLKIDGADVKAIELNSKINRYAFYNLSTLQTVTLGANVTEVGKRAFYGCNVLNVYYGGTLEQWLQINFNDSHIEANLYIDSTAVTELVLNQNLNSTNLSYLASLQKVTFNDGVTEICERAFCYCNNLKTVEISASVKKFGRDAFIGSGITEVIYNGTIDQWVGIEFELEYANPIYYSTTITMTGTSNLADVEIHSNISGYSLYGLLDLQRVTLADGVESIGGQAFGKCANLKTLVISSALKSIEMNAFGSDSYAITLDRTEYTGTMDQWLDINFDYNSNPAGYTNHLIINGVEIVDLNIDRDVSICAFSRLKSLKSVTFGNNVKVINSDAFYGCENLARVTFGDNVTTIDTNAFAHCHNLADVVFNNNLKKIGRYAFSSCYKIENVVIPDSVTEICDSAFLYCNLKSIVIGRNVSTIEPSAFFGTSDPKEVTIHSKEVYNQLSNLYSCGELPMYTKVIKVLKSIVDDKNNHSELLSDTSKYSVSQSGDYYIFTYIESYYY